MPVASQTPTHMDEQMTEDAPQFQTHEEIEPLQRISEIRDELEWYLRGCAPWKETPRISRATDAIVGSKPLKDAIEMLQTAIDETNADDLPNGYASLFTRTFRLLLSLNTHERWVRLYESKLPPSGDILRITAYPMTESTTIVVSAKYLFGEFLPTVVYDVATPHDVESECNQKSHGFERVEFHPSRDGQIGYSPRFGPQTVTGRNAIRYFDMYGTDSTVGDTSTDGDVSDEVPTAVSEISVPPMPEPADWIDDYLTPRSIERDPAMTVRRIETAQSMTKPIYPVERGMYRVGESRETEYDASDVAAPPRDDIGAVGSSTSTTPALGPGVDAPDGTTEYVVNIEPEQVTEDNETETTRNNADTAFGWGDETAACLCDDFIYHGAPGHCDCKHILLTKRLISCGLLPPPDAEPETWLNERLDECEDIVTEYTHEGRADAMRLDALHAFSHDVEESESESKPVQQFRQTVLDEIEQARQEPATTDLRALVGKISRVVAPPAEAWPNMIIGNEPIQ